MVNSVKLPSGLSELEQKFCFNYIHSQFKNAAQALRDAGSTAKFPDRVAHVMLKKPHIKSFLEINQQKFEQKIEKDAFSDFQWKLNKLKSLVEKYLPDNQNMIPNIFEARVAIQAISELNKMQGHYPTPLPQKISLHDDEDIKKGKELVLIYQREY